MPGKLAVLGEESSCVLVGISTGALAVPPSKSLSLSCSDSCEGGGGLYFRLDLHVHSTPPTSTRMLNSTYLYRSAQLHRPLHVYSTPPISTCALNSTYLYKSARLHLPLHVHSTQPTSTWVLNSTYLYRSAQLHLRLHMCSNPPTLDSWILSLYSNCSYLFCVSVITLTVTLVREHTNRQCLRLTALVWQKSSYSTLVMGRCTEVKTSRITIELLCDAP